MATDAKKGETVPVIGQVLSPLPRVTIQFCTQCKWMLRATYYAQELLSTFNLSLGEVSLQPSTGGTFLVHITTANSSTTSVTDISMGRQTSGVETTTTTLWDRKTDGGFPETKELKRRVRDVIEPGRDLGHVDRDHKRPDEILKQKNDTTSGDRTEGGEVCEDCK